MQARRLCQELEETFGFPAVIPVGSSLHGPFLLIRLANTVRASGLEDGWQLAEFLLGGAGLETVAGPLMGLAEPVVGSTWITPDRGEKGPGPPTSGLGSPGETWGRFSTAS